MLYKPLYYITGILLYSIPVKASLDLGSLIMKSIIINSYSFSNTSS